MKLLKNWSFSAIKQIYLTAYQAEYKKNQIVYNENESPDLIYVVKEGEFKVKKKQKYYFKFRSKMYKNFKIELPIQDLKTQLKVFFNEAPKRLSKPKTIEV